MPIVTGHRARWRITAAHVVLWLLIALTLFPLLAVVSISLRPGNFSTGSLIPSEISLEHWKLALGIGYTAAWIDNGGLTQVSNYFTLSGLGGIGYDFYRRLRVPISLQARSGVFWRAGTGPVEGVSYALDVGIAYQFGTGRPKPPTLPVSFPPPAEAPSNLDDPSVVEGKPPEPPPLPPPPLYPGPVGSSPPAR